MSDEVADLFERVRLRAYRPSKLHSAIMDEEVRLACMRGLPAEIYVSSRALPYYIAMARERGLDCRIERSVLGMTTLTITDGG